MEFLTLHELSVQSNVSVRVLRYRLRQLLQAGKLIDGQDYQRASFVDETHFVWKVNPATFLRAAGYQSVATPVSKVPPDVTQSDIQNVPPATHVPRGGSQTLPKVDTGLPTIEREMIDMLKEQVRVKDDQIADLTGQAKTLTALNERLTGAVVHQSEQIKQLLRLTGGKMELSDLATKPASESAATDNGFANDGEPSAKFDTSDERKAA